MSSRIDITSANLTWLSPMGSTPSYQLVISDDNNITLFSSTNSNALSLSLLRPDSIYTVRISAVGTGDLPSEIITLFVPQGKLYCIHSLPLMISFSC